MRNIFLKNHTQNMVEKLFRDPFVKNQKLSISPKFYTVCFDCILVEGYRNILKPSCIPLAIISNKAFLKKKKRSGASLLDSFSE